MSKDTPAFPNSVQPDFQFAEPGMTLRQWYAGMALAGICSAFARVAQKPGETMAESEARWCFERADAMCAFEKAEKESEHGR